MEIQKIIVGLITFMMCFKTVVMAQIRLKITRHTVCADSANIEGDELNVFGYSLYKCTEKCSLRSSCFGLTYKRAGGKCTLYLSKETLHSFKTSETPNMESNYYLNQCALIVRDDINQAEFPTPTNCEKNSEYDLSTGSCEKSECQPLPFKLSTLYGNMRSKGSKLGYTCEYDDPIVWKSTTCMDNGTWSDEPDCVNCLQFLLPSIPDAQLSSSSSFNDNHDTSKSRLDIRETCYLSEEPFSPGGWVALRADTEPFIQAMFNDEVTVNGFVIKGRDNRCDVLQYTKTYTVSYSQGPFCQGAFTPVLLDDGTQRVFEGSSSDTEVEMYSYLRKSLHVRCIRLQIIDFIEYASLRFDIFGCEEKCSSYLVSGRYGVLDIGITATTWDSYGAHVATPQRTRLDTPDTQYSFGGWFNSNANPVNRDYIQVRFRTMRRVISVITQGVNSTLHSTIGYSYNGYTETYSVAYSKDCVTFFNVTDPTTNTLKIFTGNDDMNTKVENYLPEEIHAYCVRVTPETFNVRKGLRFDLKGCVALFILSSGISLETSFLDVCNDLSHDKSGQEWDKEQDIPYNHVCPESPVHSIRPNIKSSYKIYIVPDSHAYLDAIELCLDKDGTLVNIDDSDKHSFINKMLLSCSATMCRTVREVYDILSDEDVFREPILDECPKVPFRMACVISEEMYAATAIYYVGPATANVLSPKCITMTDEGTLDLKFGPDCLNCGYICEHTFSSL